MRAALENQMQGVSRCRSVYQLVIRKQHQDFCPVGKRIHIKAGPWLASQCPLSLDVGKVYEVPPPSIASPVNEDITSLTCWTGR